jgi:hypothetical protein
LRNDLMALALSGHGGSLRADDFAVSDPGRFDDSWRGYRLGRSPLSRLAASSAAEQVPDSFAPAQPNYGPAMRVMADDVPDPSPLWHRLHFGDQVEVDRTSYIAAGDGQASTSAPSDITLLLGPHRTKRLVFWIWDAQPHRSPVISRANTHRENAIRHDQGMAVPETRASAEGKGE